MLSDLYGILPPWYISFTYCLLCVYYFVSLMSFTFSSVLVCYLLSLTLGQVLLGGQWADGADPRLSHAFDPQHHPAELLPLWHHPVKLLKTCPNLCLHAQTHHNSDTVNIPLSRTVHVHTSFFHLYKVVNQTLSTNTNVVLLYFIFVILLDFIMFVFLAALILLSTFPMMQSPHSDFKLQYWFLSLQVANNCFLGRRLM